MADPAAPAAPAPAPGGDPAPAAPAAPASLMGTPAADPAKPAEPAVPPADLAKPAEPPKPEDKPADAPAVFDPKTFKLPEGMTVDEASLGQFGELLNDPKLSPADRGEKLMSLYAEQAKKLGEANSKAWTDLNKTWVDQIKADPVIGGEKLEPTRQTISKAIDTLGPAKAAEVRQALDITGAGNNPAIVRILNEWAATKTEGGPVSGNPPTPSKSLAEAFYPNSQGMTKGT